MNNDDPRKDNLSAHRQLAEVEILGHNDPVIRQSYRRDVAISNALMVIVDPTDIMTGGSKGVHA